jgi:hypothetical protein
MNNRIEIPDSLGISLEADGADLDILFDFGPWVGVRIISNPDATVVHDYGWRDGPEEIIVYPSLEEAIAEEIDVFAESWPLEDWPETPREYVDLLLDYIKELTQRGCVDGLGQERGGALSEEAANELLKALDYDALIECVSSWPYYQGKEAK